MARFILDIAGIDPKDIKKICVAVCDRIGDEDINYGIATMNCIDPTDTNQFYNEFENGETNELSQQQIDNFKRICNE